jgi:hypothetical protein
LNKKEDDITVEEFLDLETKRQSNRVVSIAYSSPQRYTSIQEFQTFGIITKEK